MVSPKSNDFNLSLNIPNQIVENNKNSSKTNYESDNASKKRQLNFSFSFENLNFDAISPRLHSPHSNKESPLSKKGLISPRSFEKSELCNFIIPITPPLTPKSPLNQSPRQFESIKINRAENQIECVNKIDRSITKKLNKKVEKHNKKIEKQAEKASIREFNQPMLEVYAKALQDLDNYQNSHIFRELSEREQKSVIRMIKKNPSHKAYIEQSSCITMEALDKMTTLGADYNRHILYVKMYDQSNRPLLPPIRINDDVNFPHVKLKRIHRWLSVFCNKIGIIDPLKKNVMNRWEEIVSRFDGSQEVVSNAVQTFFDFLKNDEEWNDYSDEERKLMKVLAGCMATISQKLYSDPGLCVGQTTKPDGHLSAYLDVPEGKSIKIVFGDNGTIDVIVSIEKEVNARMKGEHGKPEFNEFPNVRLTLTNVMRSDFLHMDKWESKYSITVGVECIDRVAHSIIPKPDKKDIYNKVIKPLVNAGLTIENVYSY